MHQQYEAQGWADWAAGDWFDSSVSWPADAPILIRAERHIPFKYVCKVLEVFLSYDLDEHPVYLARCGAREQGLAAARRAVKQDAATNLLAVSLE